MIHVLDESEWYGDRTRTYYADTVQEFTDGRFGGLPTKDARNNVYEDYLESYTKDDRGGVRFTVVSPSVR